MGLKKINIYLDSLVPTAAYLIVKDKTPLLNKLKELSVKNHKIDPAYGFYAKYPHRDSLVVSFCYWNRDSLESTVCILEKNMYEIESFIAYTNIELEHECRFLENKKLLNEFMYLGKKKHINKF